MPIEKATDALGDMIKQSVREVLQETQWGLNNSRPGLLTIEGAAEYLSCSKMHVSNLIAAGILPAVRWPTEGTRKKPYIAVEDLAKAISDNKHREGRHGS